MFGKKVIFLIILSIISTVLIASKIAHVAEVFYRHVADSTYEVTYIESYCLNDMGLCDAGMGRYFHNMDVESQKLSMNFTILLSRVNTPYKFYSSIYNYSCGGNRDVWHHKVFRGTFSLPAKSDDWIIKTDYTYPETRYDNVDINHDFYTNFGRRTYCTINNLDFGDGNSSAVWYDEAPMYPGHTSDTILNYPYEYMCSYVEKNIDIVAYEYDGDSISYEISDPLDIYGKPMAYKVGFTSQRPFPVKRDRDFKILPGGFLHIKPDSNYFANQPLTANNRFLVGIKVREWRQDTVFVKGIPTVVWKEIGSNHRYVNIKIQPGGCAGPDLKFIRDYSGNPDIEVSCNQEKISIGFGQVHQIKFHSSFRFRIEKHSKREECDNKISKRINCF